MTQGGCLDENTVLSFLDGRLASDHARAVEDHMDACADCRVLVAELGRSLEPLDPSPSEEPRVLERGALVGRYRVLGPLGAGMMGVVYAAYDPQLARRVALKFLRPRGDESSRERMRSRILREAQAMARLAHPNVVAIHDVGTFGSEVFLAMELVEGGTLSSLRDELSQTWQKTLSAFLQAGEGLAAAHAVGIVHRDFKPENVLVGTDGRPRVGDFGLARAPTPSIPDALLADADASPDASATGTRGLLGTPAYMAPEQLRGGAAGPAADVFAFCVALYEALYGERPFPGRSLAELRKAVEVGEIRRASPQHRSVPGRVRAIVLLGLASDPERRPTMSELLAKLHEVEGRAPVGRWAVPLAAAMAVGIVSGFVTLRSRSSPVSVANAAHFAHEPPVEARPPPPQAELEPVASAPVAVLSFAPAPSATIRRSEPPTARKTRVAPAPPIVDASVATTAIADAGPFANKARALFDDPY